MKVRHINYPVFFITIVESFNILPINKEYNLGLRKYVKVNKDIMNMYFLHYIHFYFWCN